MADRRPPQTFHRRVAFTAARLGGAILLIRIGGHVPQLDHAGRCSRQSWLRPQQSDQCRIRSLPKPAGGEEQGPHHSVGTLRRCMGLTPSEPGTPRDAGFHRHTRAGLHYRHIVGGRSQGVQKNLRMTSEKLLPRKESSAIRMYAIGTFGLGRLKDRLGGVFDDPSRNLVMRWTSSSWEVALGLPHPQETSNPLVHITLMDKTPLSFVCGTSMPG